MNNPSAEWQPASRATDPASSHAAEAEVTGSGRRRGQFRTVADALAAFGRGGITTRELAEREGLDRYVVARRMGEVERAGLAVRGEYVRRGPGNRPEQVWRPPAPRGFTRQ